MEIVPGTSLIVAVDGGGSKTDAVLASLGPAGALQILGRGRSGPSNLRLAGKDRALRHLEQAISMALNEAGFSGAVIDLGVFALAGSGFGDVRSELKLWAERFGSFKRIEIIHDAEPVLHAATSTGQGVALIAGTGSVAMALDPGGRKRVFGGWGHWFGDQGSGYDLGRKALAVASEIQDGMGPDSSLHQVLLEHFNIQNLRDVLQRLAVADDVRQQIAALAPVVMDTAEQGDSAALQILNQGADHLSRLVLSLVRASGFEREYPLALAGSLVCRNQHYRELLLERLHSSRPTPGPVTLVSEPVLGCLELARSHLAKVG